ncbi:MAG: hypothetical protein IIB41_04565 [Candidatus Marinimicrobia bacterium]|nr:hypothetical protein [Candidatus Neomarinimicrobiota bacterium]
MNIIKSKSDIVHRRIISISLSCFIAMTFLVTAVSADDSKKDVEPPPNVVALYVFDDRDFNSLAVYVSTLRFPLGISVWGFTEVNATQNDPTHRFDMTRTFSEYRFSHKGLGDMFNVKGLVAQVEYNDITPQAGQLLRFGVAYKHNLKTPQLGSIGGMNGWLQWRAHPYQTNGDGGQASLIYFLPIHNKVFISGWLDLNYSESSGPKWVFGPFLNMKMSERSWVVLRYNHNGIEVAIPSLDGTGWALGVRVEF